MIAELGNSLRPIKTDMLHSNSIQLFEIYITMTLLSLLLLLYVGACQRSGHLPLPRAATPSPVQRSDYLSPPCDPTPSPTTAIYHHRHRDTTVRLGNTHSHHASHPHTTAPGLTARSLFLSWLSPRRGLLNVELVTRHLRFSITACRAFSFPAWVGSNLDSACNITMTRHL